MTTDESERLTVWQAVGAVVMTILIVAAVVAIAIVGGPAEPGFDDCFGTDTLARCDDGGESLPRTDEERAAISTGLVRFFETKEHNNG